MRFRHPQLAETIQYSVDVKRECQNKQTKKCKEFNCYFGTKLFLKAMRKGS